MKQSIKFSILLAMFFNMGALLIAQSAVKQVPLDPAYRHGKLENGLTYYIRHNLEPKNRASFYMVQNVGAMLEDDDQNGLAHFLEHMAFNGTKNFQGKGILNYLEQYGVAFGKNINAYTGTDETVYNLSNIPTGKSEVLDSCLLILHDWSNYLLLTEEEIDAERGVITEEWRTRRNAQWRMRNIQKKALYADSKYAKRDVIGSLEIIKNHKYQTLKDFYHKWYRTDLQAVVIVGDIDVDKMEEKVKKLFSKIPAVKNPAVREYYDLPDNKGARYVLATDKEATGSDIHLQYKYNVVQPKDKDINYLKNLYVKNLFSAMMGNRINERLQKENPPFIVAQAYFSNIVRTKNAAGLYIAFKENEWKTALKEACWLVENVRDYGFTEGEIKRAKISLIRNVENQYNKKDKRNHDSHAMEIKNHYLINEPVAGIEYELGFVKKVIPNVTLAEVNAVSKRFFTDDNMLITVSGPEKEGAIFPTKDEVLRVINEVKSKKLEPYVDTFVEKALISKLPAAGKISKTEKIPELDAKQVTLSNGIKVFLKHSKLEKDKILLTSYSWGGISKLDNKNIPNSMVFGSFIPAYGLGEFTSVELGKLLTGKIVSVRPGLAELSESISGNSSQADVETMFQLVHLYFTNPRFDEQAYNALHTRYKAYVKNMKNDVNKAFRDSVFVTMANHHPRKRTFGEDVLNETSFNKIKEIYKERFQDAGDFFFVISGDFDEAKLNSLLEKYIASLPVSKLKETFEDNGVRPPNNELKNHFEKEMTTPKSTVYVNFNNKFDYSEKNGIYMSVIAKLLDKRYMEEIREKEGGTYGVRVNSFSFKRPYEGMQLVLQFDCEVGNEDKLKSIALVEIDKLMKGEVNETELDEIKKNILKEKTESIERLGYWHSRVLYYGKENKFLMIKEEYTKFIESIDSKIITKKANEFLKKAVKVEVVMTAKEK
ncbi:MAG: insulinase family protein [Bacteroidota bacterium]